MPRGPRPRSAVDRLILWNCLFRAGAGDSVRVNLASLPPRPDASQPQRAKSWPWDRPVKSRALQPDSADCGGGGWRRVVPPFETTLRLSPFRNILTIPIPIDEPPGRPTTPARRHRQSGPAEARSPKWTSPCELAPYHSNGHRGREFKFHAATWTCSIFP